MGDFITSSTPKPSEMLVKEAWSQQGRRRQKTPDEAENKTERTKRAKRKIVCQDIAIDDLANEEESEVLSPNFTYRKDKFVQLGDKGFESRAACKTLLYKNILPTDYSNYVEMSVR